MGTHGRAQATHQGVYRTIEELRSIDDDIENLNCQRTAARARFRLPAHRCPSYNCQCTAARAHRGSHDRQALSDDVDNLRPAHGTLSLALIRTPALPTQPHSNPGQSHVPKSCQSLASEPRPAHGTLSLALIRTPAPPTQPHSRLLLLSIFRVTLL